jgi:hypothetical protein
MDEKHTFAIIQEAAHALGRFHDRIARSKKARNWAASPQWLC